MVEGVTRAGDLAELYDALLAPNFPAAELLSCAELVELVRSGRGSVLAVRGATGWDGIAVIEFHAAGDLLAYLAVGSAVRSGGLGAALLAAVVAQAAGRGRRYLLAEIELPGRVPERVAYGDPVRRARFYARAGAMALKVRHWQPAVGPGFEPVRLTLIVLPAVPGTVRVDAETLRRFETEYHGTATPELAATLADVAGLADVPLSDLADLYPTG